MRKAIEELAHCDAPNHVGLAYDVWAPVAAAGDDAGKVPPDVGSDWLRFLADTAMPAAYRHAFRHWQDSLCDGHSVTCTVELTSRLLIGHGNPAPTEVGLTVHHTWGVPIIPGSALKGLLAHYVDAVYGPASRRREHPFDSTDEAARFQGVSYDDRGHFAHSPGDVYRALFGAPDTPSDRDANARWRRQMEEQGIDVSDEPLPYGASMGHIIFHDALYVPDSASKNRPYAVDVLTVHQFEYYKAGMNGDRDINWPNDYDSPNPVAFLTVRPGTKFLLALTGPQGWVDLAQQLLLEALEDWGVGGKTAAGYGRAKPVDGAGHGGAEGGTQRGRRPEQPAVEPAPEVAELLALLAGAQSQSDKLAGVEERLPRLVALPQAQRDLAATELSHAVSANRKTRERLQRIQAALQSGVLEADERSEVLGEFEEWLTAQPGREPETVFDEFTDAWEARLKELPADERTAAIRLIRETLVDDAYAEVVELLAEALGGD